MKTWTLQDAKNLLSAVVEAALAGSAQFLTRRRREAVVVVATEEYERLRRAERAQGGSPVEHLLAMPRDDGILERATLAPRDAGF